MEEKITIPEKIGVEINKEILVQGPKGEISKKIFHPLIKIKKEGQEIMLSSEKDNRKAKRLINTFASKITNMIEGVQEEYEYKLKICYKHFPISIEVKDCEILIKNFLHEKKPRKAKVIGDTKVEVEEDTITVKGVDKEDSGQTAANIEQATKTSQWDKRVIGDGIYIVKKPGGRG